MKPHQIITLMAYPNADNTLALPDPRRPHPRRLPAADGQGARRSSTPSSSPGQWDKLIDRLGTLEKPDGRACKPSKVRGCRFRAQHRARGATELSAAAGGHRWAPSSASCSSSFPGPLGPEDGRYVLRRHAGEDPDHVLVLRHARGPPSAAGCAGGAPKARSRPAPEPEPVVTAAA